MMTLVEHDGMFLERADPDLQDHKELVLAAVKQNREAFKFASPRLQNDRDVLDATGLSTTAWGSCLLGKSKLQSLAR